MARLPAPPATFTTSQRTLWRQIGGWLVAQGTWRPAYRLALGQLCEAQARYDDLSRQVAKGLLFKDGSGRTIANPLLGAQATAFWQVQKLCADLGLSPAALKSAATSVSAARALEASPPPPAAAPADSSDAANRQRMQAALAQALTELPRSTGPQRREVLATIRACRPDGGAPTGLPTASSPSGARAGIELLVSFRAFAQRAWREIEAAPLVWGWHLDAWAGELERAAVTPGARLAFSAPPRSGKTLVTSVLWLAWLALRNPALRIFLASHHINRAAENVRLVRKLLGSALVTESIGSIMSSERKDRIELTGGGSLVALSLGTGFTGFGFEVGVIDDAHDLKDFGRGDRVERVARWYETAWRTRRNSAAAIEIVTQQRVSTNDLVGVVTREHGFRSLNVPALADPEVATLADDPRAAGEALMESRFPRADLERERSQRGRDFEVIFQGAPSTVTGALFRREQLPPARPWTGVVVRRLRYWDTASTVRDTRHKDPDWTVGAKVSMTRCPKDGVCRFRVDDLIRVRESPTAVQRLIFATAKADGADVDVLEAVTRDGAGKTVGELRAQAFARHFRSQARRPSYAPRIERGEKAERWAVLANQCGLGNVRLAHGRWTEAFLAELCPIEDARHDDQADAASGAVIDLLLGLSRSSTIYVAGDQA